MSAVSTLAYCSFFHEFFAVLVSLRNERNHNFLMTFTRGPIDYVTFDGILKNYADFLTPYSFEFVREQFNKASSLSNMSQTGTDTFAVASAKDDDPIITTAETCTCSFAKRMGLPCRHIFKARKILQLPLFESSLVKKRWTRDFYKKVERLSIYAGQRRGRRCTNDFYRRLQYIASFCVSTARELGENSFPSTKN